MRIRQGNPGLNAVKCPGFWSRYFRMLDPSASSHDVEFAQNHQCVSSGRVAVVDASLNEPTHGLQSGMWMRGHDHPTRIINEVGAIVVEKTPRANGGAIPVWQGPTNRHRPYAPQRNLPRDNNLNP